MVKVDIAEEEIKALDVLLDKAEVKPIIGFKVVSMRYKIEIALQKKAEQDKKEKK